MDSDPSSDSSDADLPGAITTTTRPKSKKGKKITADIREFLNEEIRKTRPPLEKGINLFDLQNKYWCNELRHFCGRNGLKTYMKKSDMDHVICVLLNDGEDAVPKHCKSAQKKHGNTATQQ
jgi:hypothetical protein